MRKKLKPDLNLEEIQQSLIDQVVELYASGMSMRNIGTQLSLSQMKVRKILITAGAYTSERCDEINDYVDNSPKLYNSYHFKIVQSISFAK